MKITPHIPLKLQHFEIGGRTLFAVFLSCLTLLLITWSNIYGLSTDSPQVESDKVKILTSRSVEPMNAKFSPPISNQKTKDKDKVYALSAILAPQALARRGLKDAKIEALQALCRSYVEHYAPLALIEKEKFGIPVSVTLAQALLESDAGQSRLALQNNNHFGIKCFSKKCEEGHCSNFSDDHHKDFFRKYKSVWESYRDHSIFLRKKRYRKCFELASDDYKAWARELSRAGYATDKKYADKLIMIIESMDLWQLDG